MRKSANSILGYSINEDLYYNVSFYDILTIHKETLNYAYLQSQN